MAIANGYATLAELKALIEAEGALSWSANDDTALELAIEAASRWIDETFGRYFYDNSSATYYYRPQWGDVLHVHDLQSITTLKADENEDGTYEITWTTDDYQLEPVNGLPKTSIILKPDGDYTFPVSVDIPTVEIVGDFGWSAVPTQVKALCLLVAHRLWARHGAIFGVSGTPAAGVTMVHATISADSDVQALMRSVPARAIDPDE